MPETPDFSDESSAALFKSRLKSGVLLVAREALTDPNFSNTIVLLCQHSGAGAYGLVLNRTAHMPLHEVFEHPPAAGVRSIHIGGPVQSTELQILQIGTEAVPESLEVSAGVFLGGAWEQIEDFLGMDPGTIRLFLGYAGWGEGQLEEEIDAAAWEVWETDIQRLLMHPDPGWMAGREAFHRYLRSCLPNN